MNFKGNYLDENLMKMIKLSKGEKDKKSEQLINPFLSLIVVSVFFCLLHFYGVEEINDVAFVWFNSKQ